MEKKIIAVVTGSNKGIGFEIVKQLAKHGVTTVLTARDESRGAQAVESLKSQGLDVEFHQLDVSDPASVQGIASWIQEKFGSFDILVNNAGITSYTAPDPGSLEERIKVAEAVLETNYYGAKRMTEASVLLLKPGGRIINVSSRLGQFETHVPGCKLTNEFQKRSFSDVANLSEGVIDSCLKEFMRVLAIDRLKEEGYPVLVSDYCISKFALNAYSRHLAPRLLEEKKISINCMCPGYTKTDLTRGKRMLSVEEGADTAVWLAVWNESDEYPSGKFWAERKEIKF